MDPTRARPLRTGFGAGARVGRSVGSGPVVDALPRARMHVVDGADHGFHVLKRSGRTDAEVLEELADETLAFVKERPR